MSTDTEKLVAGPWYAKPEPEHRGLAGVWVNADNAAGTPIIIAHDLRPARAALIVRAVNSHDGLVDVCERLVAHVEKLDHMYEAKMQESCGTVEIALQACAALAKAKP